MTFSLYDDEIGVLTGAGESNTLTSITYNKATLTDDFALAVRWATADDNGEK